MYKNFNLTESEREQILSMHQAHGYGKSINEETNNCLSQFKKTPKGSKGRFGGVTDYDGWSGTFEGYNISITSNGTCKLIKSQSKEKIIAKWKCDNGTFRVYDKKQQTWTID